MDNTPLSARSLVGDTEGVTLGNDALGAGAEHRRAQEDASTLLKSLQAVDWNFASAKTDYLAHGIHPYPAKFIPQLPNTLISMLSERGDVVWDPFGGSGTTALEALLLGRRAISSDLNPVAEVIGRAKTVTITPEIDLELSRLVTELRMVSSSKTRIDEALAPVRANDAHIPSIPNHEKWFTKEATDELAYLKFRIEHLMLDASKDVARACFSKEVLGASNQDSETRYTAVEKGNTLGSVIQRFTRSLTTSIDRLRLQAEHLQFRRALFFSADLRDPIVGLTPESKIAPGSVDLVVTSPPYPNATDYHLYHRFRIFWLGHDPRPLANSEIGSHLRHQKQKSEFNSYIDEMTLALRNVYEALKPGCVAVFIVGDAMFNKELFETATHLGNAAKSIGFEKIGVVNRELPTNKRSFSSPARRLRTEQLLILRKPAELQKLVLKRPRYKLQPYEERLSRREAKALLGNVDKSADGLVTHVTSAQWRRAKNLAFTSAISFPTGYIEPTWQGVLETYEAPSSRKKDSKYVTHGIHPYKGKFYPQLAKALFNASEVQPGSTVLDPFCGSGTVLLEAALLGCEAVGFDVNPVAVATASAKAAAVTADAVFRDHLLFSFEEKLQAMSRRSTPATYSSFSDDTVEEILSWFPTPVVHKMSAVLAEIDDVPDGHTRDLLRVSLSSIIRQISHQDPRDLRIRRRADVQVDAPVYELLTQRVRDLRQKLRHFASVKHFAPHPLGNGRAILGASDAPETFRQASIEDSSIDLVVTSPPYATALPYIDTDRLSMLVTHGMTSATRKDAEAQLIGSREITARQRNELNQRIEAGEMSVGSMIANRLIKTIHYANKGADVGFRRMNTAALLVLYFEKMNRVVRNITRVVKQGGSAFVVIGDTKTTAGGEVVSIRSGRVIEEQFHAAGWRTERVLPITVTRGNVVHSKNTITDNEIFWFKKS